MKRTVYKLQWSTSQKIKVEKFTELMNSVSVYEYAFKTIEKYVDILMLRHDIRSKLLIIVWFTSIDCSNYRHLKKVFLMTLKE